MESSFTLRPKRYASNIHIKHGNIVNVNVQLQFPFFSSARDEIYEMAEKLRLERIAYNEKRAELSRM
jgi:hypothetical protein